VGFSGSVRAALMIAPDEAMPDPLDPPELLELPELPVAVVVVLVVVVLAADPALALLADVAAAADPLTVVAGVLSPPPPPPQAYTVSVKVTNAARDSAALKLSIAVFRCFITTGALRARPVLSLPGWRDFKNSGIAGISGLFGRGPATSLSVRYRTFRLYQRQMKWHL
jgi:hypothetical protein